MGPLDSKIAADFMGYVRVNLHFSLVIRVSIDNKKIAEYVDGVSTRKGSEDFNGDMAEETVIDKETIIHELKQINMKNWQSIVSENVNFCNGVMSSHANTRRFYGVLIL